MEEHLKKYIEKLVHIEEEEEKYKHLFANMKKEKETIQHKLLSYMEENKIQDKSIVYGDKKIKYVNLKIQDTVTKKLIQERLKIFLKNEDLAVQATEFIYADRKSHLKQMIKMDTLKKTD